jgi:hypothetical protein
MRPKEVKKFAQVYSSYGRDRTPKEKPSKISFNKNPSDEK